MGIAKFFVGDQTHTLKIKLRNNQSVVEFRNHDSDTVKLRTSSAVGVLDLRSLGYFKVGYQILVSMAEKHFTFHHYGQLTDINNSKEHSESQPDSYFRISDQKTRDITTRDPYPWLANDDPCRFQTDAEILYEKIDLKESALTSKEKTKLMKMFLRYRQAFSLRDEIRKVSKSWGRHQSYWWISIFCKTFSYQWSRQTIHG